MSEGLINADQVKGLVEDAVKAAIIAVNTVDPASRPASPSAAPPSAPAWIKRRQFPSLTRALKAARSGSFAKAGFELEVSNAAKVLWYDQKDDDVAERSLVWPTTIDQALQLFDHMGETKATKELDRLDDAKVHIESLSLHQPTLDDAFLSLTGHAATKAAPEEEAKKGKKEKK